MRKKSTPLKNSQLPDSDSDAPSPRPRKFSNLPDNYENDVYEGIDSVYSQDLDSDEDMDREPDLEELKPDLDDDALDLADDDFDDDEDF
ncbi:MAG: hypothetical protein N2050_02285 [Flavobacteriales bacterium]|nr:hypothetical protein [Flavobacteriales bacterium]MCX7649367.1 hypothetical protein [Flavobacteriales bacterium]MDW8432760.1 hypothetical protein [Flavobacteriales bacterium]